MNRYGPSRRRALDASAALRIFVRHPEKTFATISADKQLSAPGRSPNAIPVRDYERVVDDVKYIRATIEHSKAGRWRSRTTCRSGVEAPLARRVRQLLPTTQ